MPKKATQIDGYWCEYVREIELEAEGKRGLKNLAIKHIEQECSEYLKIRNKVFKNG